MEKLSALLALCAGNSPVTSEFPAQRPVTRSFDVFFNVRVNKQLSKQSRCRWFETPWRSLWRHYNDRYLVGMHCCIWHHVSGVCLQRRSFHFTTYIPTEMILHIYRVLCVMKEKYHYYVMINRCLYLTHPHFITSKQMPYINTFSIYNIAYAHINHIALHPLLQSFQFWHTGKGKNIQRIYMYILYIMTMNIVLHLPDNMAYPQGPLSLIMFLVRERWINVSSIPPVNLDICCLKNINNPSCWHAILIHVLIYRFITFS